MEEEKFIKKFKFYVNSYDDFSPIEYQITFGNSVNKTLDAYIRTKIYLKSSILGNINIKQKKIFVMEESGAYLFSIQTIKERIILVI